MSCPILFMLLENSEIGLSIGINNLSVKQSAFSSFECFNTPNLRQTNSSFFNIFFFWRTAYPYSQATVYLNYKMLHSASFIYLFFYSWMNDLVLIIRKEWESFEQIISLHETWSLTKLCYLLGLLFFSFIFLFSIYISKLFFFLVFASKSIVVSVKKSIVTDYDHDQVGLVAPDNGALHSFQAEHETNLIYSNQQMNIQPEIVTPFEHMPMYVKLFFVLFI